LFFHINSVDKSIATSDSSQFLIDLAESVFLGLMASASLFFLFPASVPRVDMAILALLLIGFLPVGARFFLRHAVPRGKFVDEILIVGTGDLPARLHRALGGGV
jgi:hypothetical protein